MSGMRGLHEVIVQSVRGEGGISAHGIVGGYHHPLQGQSRDSVTLY